MFAILTALGNFGASISAYSGSLVLQYFEIRDGNYDNLVLVIFLKCASRLLPMLLIPLLVPRGAPFEAREGSVAGGGGGGEGEELELGSRRKGLSGPRRTSGYESLGVDSSHGAESYSSNSSCSSSGSSSHLSISSRSSGSQHSRVDEVVIGTNETRSSFS